MRHQDTGIPGSPPPWDPGPSRSGFPQHDVGKRHGFQADHKWPAVGQREQRQLLSAELAVRLWRVTVTGVNVTVTLRYGTQASLVLSGLRPPLRIVVPGQVELYATPDTPDVYAEAQATLTPVSSGLGEQDCRYLITGAQDIPANAVRFRATAASVVSIGGLSNCVLASTQAIPLIERSTLVSGSGYLEFDP